MKDHASAIAKALNRGDVSNLNAVQLKMLDIYNLADNLITLYGPGKKTAHALMEVVEQRYGDKISRTSSYQYIINAQTVLGSQCVFNKAYYKGFLAEKLINLINQLEKDAIVEVDILDKEGATTGEKATKSGDAKLIKNYIEAIQKLSDLLELDKEEPLDNTDDHDGQVMITSNPEDVGFEKIVELPADATERLRQLGAKMNDDGTYA